VNQPLFATIGVLGPSVDYSSTGRDMKRSFDLLEKENGFPSLNRILRKYAASWTPMQKPHYAARVGLKWRGPLQPASSTTTIISEMPSFASTSTDETIDSDTSMEASTMQINDTESILEGLSMSSDKPDTQNSVEGVNRSVIITSNDSFMAADTVNDRRESDASIPANGALPSSHNGSSAILQWYVPCAF
jgi:hypothetical protein